MNTMTQESQSSVARNLGRYAAKVVPTSHARKLVMGGLIAAMIAGLALVAFASAKSSGTDKHSAYKIATPREIKLADVIHQQGPRSHRMIPFTVTKGGMVKIEVHVSYEGEAELFVVPGWQRGNVYATLSNPLFGPGYTYCSGFSLDNVAGTKVIRGRLEAGEYCAVLINRQWIYGIETKTAITETPTF